MRTEVNGRPGGKERPGDASPGRSSVRCGTYEPCASIRSAIGSHADASTWRSRPQTRDPTDFPVGGEGLSLVPVAITGGTVIGTEPCMVPPSVASFRDLPAPPRANLRTHRGVAGRNRARTREPRPWPRRCRQMGGDGRTTRSDVCRLDEGVVPNLYLAVAFEACRRSGHLR
jgi:hypothetical protein